jgi:hypothetical protein
MPPRSRVARDGHFPAGMEVGTKGALVRLDEHTVRTAETCFSNGRTLDGWRLSGGRMESKG